MEAPGSSIFAGAGSLHIDRSAQERLEEQEDLEDRQRRAVELKANLDHAFDDFVDDDEPSSVNSSHDHTSLEASRALRSNPHAPGSVQTRSRNPPTYVESLSHLKEAASYDAAIQAHEGTPMGQHGFQLYEQADARCSPCGAGDAQENCYYPNEYRASMSCAVHQHNGGNAYEAKQQQLNHEQLTMMYNMRVKECQQLADQLVEVQRGAEKETDELRARLAAARADAEQARLAAQQAQHMLATGKHQLAELQQQLTEQREATARAAADKEAAAHELRATALALQDAQQRLQKVQLARNHNTDVLFREQQDRHREECEHLRQDLERTKNRLEEKDKESLVLERRCLEAERAREEAVVERGAVVNRLAAELEAAQARPAAAAHQLKELGSKLEQTAQELVVSRREAARARGDLDEWRAQLRRVMQEAAPEAFRKGSSPSSPDKLAMLKDLLSRSKQQGHQLGKLTDEINKKDKKLESCRKLECELRSKLEEHKGIEMQLNSRLAVLQKKLDLLGSSNDADLLDSYKHQNQQLETEIETLRKELKTAELNYTELELQHGRLKSEKGRRSLEREANADLRRELERLGAQAQDSLRENGELKSLYLQVCSARDALSRELSDARAQLSSLQRERDAACEREGASKEEVERERQQTERLTRELAAERAELQQARRRIVEQQKEYTDKQKEIADKLDKYIRDESVAVCKRGEPCAECVRLTRSVGSLQAQAQQYKIKLEAQESNELLLKELQSKAEYFQQYIVQRFERLRDQRHVGTNTGGVEHERRRPDGQDGPPGDGDAVGSAVENGQTVENGRSVEKGRSVENGRENGCAAESRDKDEDTFASRTDMMMKEKHIREQIAEQYTLEIKAIEMSCAKRISDLQKDNSATTSKLRELLEKKAEEVEMLKKYVVSERAKITELLQSKEKDIASVIQENRSLQEEYRALSETSEQLKQSLEKSNGRSVKLKAELERKMEEMAAERERSARALGELAGRLRALDARTARAEAQHDAIREKYRGVKKTALVYKEYASKKDAHVETELERIRSHYEAEVARLREKLQRLGKKRREIQVNERISKMQSDFDAMVSEVNAAT